MFIEQLLQLGPTAFKFQLWASRSYYSVNVELPFKEKACYTTKAFYITKANKQKPLLKKIKLQSQVLQSSERCNLKFSKQALTYAAQAWQCYVKMKLLHRGEAIQCRCHV